MFRTIFLNHAIFSKGGLSYSQSKKVLVDNSKKIIKKYPEYIESFTYDTKLKDYPIRFKYIKK